MQGTLIQNNFFYFQLKKKYHCPKVFILLKVCKGPYHKITYFSLLYCYIDFNENKKEVHGIFWPSFISQSNTLLLQTKDYLHYFWDFCFPNQKKKSKEETILFKPHIITATFINCSSTIMS